MPCRIVGRTSQHRFRILHDGVPESGATIGYRNLQVPITPPFSARGREVLASEFIKEHSRRIADVMTRNVGARHNAASTIANLLERNAIKRVPIVEDGKVVGVDGPSEPAASPAQA